MSPSPPHCGGWPRNTLGARALELSGRLAFLDRRRLRLDGLEQLAREPRAVLATLAAEQMAKLLHVHLIEVALVVVCPLADQLFNLPHGPLPPQRAAAREPYLSSSPSSRGRRRRPVSRSRS